MPAGWAAAAAAVVGAVASSDSSRKASNQQADAARAANATQSDAQSQARADNLPWMNRGNAAGDRLQYLLGLGGGSGSGQSPSGAPVNFTSDQLRSQLLGQYTTNPTGLDLPAYNDALSFSRYNSPDANSPDLANFAMPGVVDEYALNNEINRRLQQQQDSETLRQQAGSAQSSDPAYGSLLRKFSSADMANDPVYQNGLQFGLDQGVQGLSRQAAANGSLNSGATLKALTRFGNDFATTKTADSANRYTANQQQQFNMLSGVSGTGQVANNQVGTVGMNAANNISQNQVGVGNARAASALSGANGITSGINSGINYYQGSRLVDSLNNRNPSTGSTSTNYQTFPNSYGSTTTASDAGYWE